MIFKSLEIPHTNGLSLEQAAAAWAATGLRLCYENEDGERPAGAWRYADRDKKNLKRPDTPEEAVVLIRKYQITKVCVEPAENLVVLDVDHRPNFGWDAKAIGKELCERYEIPARPMVSTPSGGFHLWLRLPNGFRAKNWTSESGKFAIKGVDIRTLGGLATIPPSFRTGTAHKSAGDYKWIGTCRHLPMASQKLVEALTPESFEIPSGSRNPFHGDIHPWIATMLNAQLDEIAGCGKGGRNAQLFKSSARVASFVAGGELPNDASRAALFNAASSCGLVKEDGQQAVLATINSAFASGMQQPRNRPEGA